MTLGDEKMVKAANRNYKDNIFRYLFKEEANFVEAYKELSGRELHPEEVEFYDTSSLVLSRELKNEAMSSNFSSIYGCLLQQELHELMRVNSSELRRFFHYKRQSLCYVSRASINALSQHAHSLTVVLH